MKFAVAVNADKHKVISLVGAGGKTTTMFALAQELVLQGDSVVTTTTTRIARPLLTQSSQLVVELDENKLEQHICQCMSANKHVTVASAILDSGKLKGVSANMVNRLAGCDTISRIIVEADGAAQKPFKVPGANEPVIPDTSSLVIVVVGYDVLGTELTDDNVFRADLASQLLGVPLGTTVSIDMVAALVTHPQGLVKGIPYTAEIICFINKVRTIEDKGNARELSRLILNTNCSRINRVVMGEIKLKNPLWEVLARQNVLEN